MAWADTPYATAPEYRQRNQSTSTVNDLFLTALLLSISRLIDRRVGVAPAHFAPQSAVTATFVGMGSNLLYLRDERGWQHFLRTVDADGIDVDSELDGTFDGYTLDLSDAWVRGWPLNGATYGEPYTALMLAGGVTSAAPLTWADGCEVRITGSWGYAATPGAIKERVIGITREVIETHRGGPTMNVLNVEEAIELNPTARMLMGLLEQEYRRRIPSFG